MSQGAPPGILLEYTQDKIILLDEDGKITYANAAVPRMLGWEPEELVGRNAFENIHPADVGAVRDAFETTITSDNREDATVEYRHRHKDGTWVWLESRMSNVTDDVLDGYVVSSRDVTNRIEAQRERRETAERLAELTKTTADVMWMFTADWSEMLFVNPAYEDVYGRPAAELEEDPENFLEAIHPDDIPAVRDAMESLSNGKTVDMEYRVNPDREYGVWVWVQAEPIVVEGDVRRIAGFSRDVTDRYRRERQLVVMDNLLRHNLRNDLNIILGNAEMIDDQSPAVSEKTAVIRRTAEDLLQSADKERTIIEILTSGTSPVNLDLTDATATAVAIVRDRHPNATIDFSATESVWVNAIEEVEIAVVELVENAIEHSERSHPSVGIELDARGETVHLRLSETGAPMPEMEADVLRGNHESSDIYHSSGLGLWLIYWVVELSRGDVEVQKRSTDGNTIRLSLPAGENPSPGADDACSLVGDSGR